MYNSSLSSKNLLARSNWSIISDYRFAQSNTLYWVLSMGYIYFLNGEFDISDNKYIHLKSFVIYVFNKEIVKYM